MGPPSVCTHGHHLEQGLLSGTMSSMLRSYRAQGGCGGLRSVGGVGVYVMRGLVALLATAVASAQHEADVVVYGSTPGAITAAVAAARQGTTTILVDPSPRVGGMCSGGLGRTDRGNSVVIGGYAQEFFARNRAHYHPGTPIAISLFRRTTFGCARRRTRATWRRGPSRQTVRSPYAFDVAAHRPSL